jgi:MerR family transcriptional regulator, light-induced transcriptional regulator
MADDAPLPILPPVDTAAADRFPPEAMSPELLASLLADGDDELAAWTMSQALLDTPRTEVFDGLLADAMRLVGERWSSGQWTVAEEHLASQTLMRALGRIRPDLGPEGRIGPLAVLAGVAGEHHMIGLVCLDQVLRERGWTVANLGADVPAGDLARFLARNEAKLVAITASDPARIAAVAETIATARREAPGVPIMLGGRLTEHDDVAKAVGADWRGHRLTEAAGFADGILGQLSIDET